MWQANTGPLPSVLCDRQTNRQTQTEHLLRIKPQPACSGELITGCLCYILILLINGIVNTKTVKAKNIHSELQCETLNIYFDASIK